MIINFNDFINEEIMFTDNIELSTDLLPIIDITYSGSLDPENMINAEIYDENDDDYGDWIYELIKPDEKEKFEGMSKSEIYWEKFSYEKYDAVVLEEAKKFIKENVVPFFRKLKVDIKNIVPTEIYCKNRGYTKENLFYDLRVGNNYKQSIMKKLNTDNYSDEKMNSFLKEKFKSYDGFASFMPKSKEELIIDLNDYKDSYKGVTAFLTYEIEIIHNMPNYWQKEFEDYILDSDLLKNAESFVEF